MPLDVLNTLGKKGRRALLPPPSGTIAALCRGYKKNKSFEGNFPRCLALQRCLKTLVSPNIFA